MAENAFDRPDCGWPTNCAGDAANKLTDVYTVALHVDKGSAGTVISLVNLPTSDPSVAGQVWSNSGVLTVSAG